MPKTTFEIENASLGFSSTEPTNADDVTLAVLADYSDFTCQMTEGRISSTPQTSTRTIPATGCDPEETRTVVGQSLYNLVIGALQDPEQAAGLAQFLAANDSQLVWFYLGFDGDDLPKAIGQCRAVAQDFGGTMREVLQASITLPIEGVPSREYGDSTTSVVV